MNTVAHSAAAVCCLSDRDARRWDRCGWRATWVEWRPADITTWTGHPANLTVHKGWATKRRWTR